MTVRLMMLIISTLLPILFMINPSNKKSAKTVVLALFLILQNKQSLLLQDLYG